MRQPNIHTQTECEERNTHLSNSATDIGFFSTGLHFQFHPHSSSRLTFPSSSVKKKMHKKLLIVSKMETKTLTLIREVEQTFIFYKSGATENCQ